MSTVLDYREHIKLALMKRLYQAQFRHWNNKLILLSKTNAQCYGRSRYKDNYGVYFKNKSWYPEHLDWTNKEENKYCLPLHPDFPNMLIEMGIIAEELQELQDEKYEADRFLSGLVLFNMPPNIMKETLGHTLYAPVRFFIERFASDLKFDWSESEEFSLITYIGKNQTILKAMHERLMLNLITLNNPQNN
jgi:hypothetical protein